MYIQLTLNTLVHRFLIPTTHFPLLKNPTHKSIYIIIYIQRLRLTSPLNKHLLSGTYFKISEHEKNQGYFVLFCASFGKPRHSDIRKQKLLFVLVLGEGQDFLPSIHSHGPVGQ